MNNYQTINFDDEATHQPRTIDITLNEVENCINRLKNEIKKKHIDFSLLKNICYKLIVELPIPIHFYQNTWVIRSRSNFDNEIFSAISEISYNPVTEDIKLNRFNLDKEAVFYCAAPIASDTANGSLTTICESNKDLFDKNNHTSFQYYTISKWNVVKPIRMIMLTFYDTALNNSLHVQNINQHFQIFLKKIYGGNDLKKCELFFGYFSEAAGKKFDTNYNYLLTTAFFHALQEYYGKEIGILYSSSMTDNHGLNIALAKEIIDLNYLELDSVIMYKCHRDIANFKFKLEPCTSLVIPNAEGKF